MELAPDDLLLPGEEEHRQALERTPGADSLLKNVPLAGGIILNMAEGLWLFSCFLSSEWVRSCRQAA